MMPVPEVSVIEILTVFLSGCLSSDDVSFSESVNTMSLIAFSFLFRSDLSI